MDKTPSLVKETGKVQRTDVALTSSIASALADVILEGKTIYPKSGRLEITYPGADGSEITETLSIHTIDSWVKRGNVIPGMNVALRDFLDGKRADKRAKDRQAAHQALIDEH